MEDPDYLAAAEQASMNTEYMDPAETGELLAAQYTFCTDTVSQIWE